jgi:hypothetical protein
MPRTPFVIYKPGVPGVGPRARPRVGMSLLRDMTTALLLAKCSEDMQTLLQAVAGCCQASITPLNFVETLAMVYLTAPRRPPPFPYEGQQLNHVDHCRHLGVMTSITSGIRDTSSHSVWQDVGSPPSPSVPWYSPGGSVQPLLG